MSAVQLDFFYDETSYKILAIEKEQKNVKVSCEKVRKKLFAENNALRKDVDDLQNRLKILEKYICTGGALPPVTIIKEEFTLCSETY
jgi:hypothetical protein